MGKVTLSSQNSSVKSATYAIGAAPIISLPPIQPTVIEVPVVQYIEKIVEVPVIEYLYHPKEIKIVETIQYVDKIVEKIVEVPKEVVVEKIVEVPNYDLYDNAVIQYDILKRKHNKLKKQIKIFIAIIAIAAITAYII